MPSFDFKCECGHITTALVKAGVDEYECEKCGKMANKMFSSPTIHFKGDGFYSSKTCCNNKCDDEK